MCTKGKESVSGCKMHFFPWLSFTNNQIPLLHVTASSLPSMNMFYSDLKSVEKVVIILEPLLCALHIKIQLLKKILTG